MASGPKGDYHKLSGGAPEDRMHLDTTKSKTVGNVTYHLLVDKAPSAAGKAMNVVAGALSGVAAQFKRALGPSPSPMQNTVTVGGGSSLDLKVPLNPKE